MMQNKPAPTAAASLVFLLAFDKLTLRVNAIQLGDKIRDLQRRRRLIFAGLKKAGVLKRDN
jgi:hypothetical protein